MGEAALPEAASPPLSAILDRFFFGAFFLLLFLCLPYLRRAWGADLDAHGYALALWLAQAALYLAPAYLATQSARWLFLREGTPRAQPRAARTLVGVLALVLTTFTAIAVEADVRVFEIFGFHLNGFVLNLVTTPGGVDSMGIGREGVVWSVSVVLGLAAATGLLFWASQRSGRWSFPRPLRRGWVLALLLVASLGERVVYAVSEARSDASVLEQANTFPLYFPITARKRLIRYGFVEPRGEELPDLSAGPSALDYPRKPLRVEPPARPLNVVWLVGESLRWDLLDPAIMPRADALARDAWRFERHYSGGNGTRMGMFSMFYGVHGPYWFAFLEERRSPLLVDVLQQQGYQLGLFTSARFSYPEFDRTIFAEVPTTSMRDSAESYYSDDWEKGWRNDRARVSELIEFLEQRDRSRPFFAFMFFESTHYRYYFPDESVIRRPYAEVVDLDGLAGPEGADLEYARYVNAAHHLDSQVERILDYLGKDGRMQDTLVLLTGDHGEEFWEKGRKGHNSEFHEEQLRVPLVLWIPGDGSHEVGEATSHVDIAPTILPLLGVRNPPGDYSLGMDLRKPVERDFVVVADWSRIGVVGSRYKLTLPIKGTGLLKTNALTTRDDQALSDPGGAYRAVQTDLRQAIAELRRFRHEPGALHAEATIATTAGGS